jgi:hypothetical protein
MAQPPSGTNFDELADGILQFCIRDLDLLPEQALVALMTAAASIVGSVDEVPALIGFTKTQAVTDFERLIDAVTAARNAERVPPAAGTA